MQAFAGACRRTRLGLLAGASVLALAFLAPAAARADDCPFADAQPGQATPDQLDQATVCLLNQQRAANGLQPLAPSQPLDETATKYAAYMVSTDHFAHMDESGGTVVNRVIATDPSLAGRWDVLGENLGWGTYSLATPRAMVEGWMNSPSHRANILYPDYDQIGVGTAQGAPEPGITGGVTYTTVFGKISPQAAPAPAKKATRKKATRKHTRRHRMTAAQRRRAQARARAAARRGQRSA